MPSRAELREKKLADLEDETARLATGTLRRELEEITRKALADFEQAEEIRRPAILKALSESLEKIADEDSNAAATIELVIDESVREAFGLGVDQATEDLDRPKGDVAAIPRTPAQTEGAGAVARAREELQAARNLLSGVQETRDLEDALLRARRAVTRVENTARYSVNRAAAEGVAEVADTVEASRLWIGERDACVHCAAYIGVAAGTDEDFPGGRTFGKKPLSLDPVPNPPLHPLCRCRIRVWRAEWDAPGTSTPEALQREALRSILRGWSLPSESERVRLDAAERALKRVGGEMPKSVQDYARRAVKKGTFPRGRDFPDAPKRDELPKTVKPDLAKEALPEIEEKPVTGRAVTVLGDALHVAPSKTSARELEDLNRIPTPFLAALKEHGSTVWIGPGNVTELDDLGDLVNEKPRGWSEGKTFRDVAGVHDPSRKVIAIGDIAHGSHSLALHEGGHGIDDAVGPLIRGDSLGPHRGAESEWSVFRNLYRRLKRELNLKPYFAQAGTGGPSETWAESFAVWSGNREMSRESLIELLWHELTGARRGVRPVTEEERAVLEELLDYFTDVEKLLERRLSE